MELGDLSVIMGRLDFAQITLYVFWVFFFGLIFWIQKESRREGYPLESDTGVLENPGVIFMPDPKTFKMPHGAADVVVPNDVRETRNLALRRTSMFDGAPYEPTGNPMKDGVGPASYAERADHPDWTMHGQPKIVPMSTTNGEFTMASQNPSPVGMKIIGCDGQVAGTVSDIWVDKSEFVVRYYQIELNAGGTVLLPHTFAWVRKERGEIYVHSITSSQFADVPQTKKSDQITLLEEDMICGYYGGGQ
ncbi:MAG: photosynthetic reaction center subunit H, partial [Pseudomonadota bacterium]